MSMKISRRLAVAAALAALFAILPNHAEAYSCVRHIYNKSSCPWRVQVSQNFDPSYGNVYFAMGNCTQAQPPGPNSQVQQNVPKELSASPGGCTSQNGPCTVPAFCTVAMQFTYTGNRTAGNLILTDGAGKGQAFVYDTKADGTLEQCPYLRHSGNTGGASLNDPANDDVSIGQCNW